MGKLYQSTDIKTTEYDGATGEVTAQTETETRVFRFGQEPDYVKLYLEDVLYLSDMPTQYSATLMALLKRTTYAGEENGMCVVLAPLIRDQICKEVGFEKRQSLSNVLQKLVKGEILYHVGRGVYRLNPYLFGRGTWADIAKIRMEVNYIPGKGRTFQTTIEKAIQQKKDLQSSRPPEPAEEELPGQTSIDDLEEEADRLDAAEKADRYDPYGEAV